MSQCLNPKCNLQNLDRSLSFCQECGSKLKIGDRYRAEKILGQGGFGRTFIGLDEALPSYPPCVIKQRQFKDEMQRGLMKQRILRKGCDSQEIFSVCDL